AHLRLLRLTPPLRGEGVEAADVGIARIVEDGATLVDQSEEHGVERLPARGVGGAGRLAGEIEKLAGDSGAAGGRRSWGKGSGGGLAPRHLLRRHGLVQ